LGTSAFKKCERCGTKIPSRTHGRVRRFCTPRCSTLWWNAYYKSTRVKRGLNPKICVTCKKKYKPTSSAQKRCIGCRHLLNGQYNGFTETDYRKLYKKQKGKCALCDKPEKIVQYGKRRSLGVDHNHKTGIVRGLLCRSCNSALGVLGDDVAGLRKALRYVKGVI